MSIVSVETVRARLRESDEAGINNLIESIIDRVARSLEGLTGKRFTQISGFIEKIDGGDSIIFCSNIPIISISEIKDTSDGSTVTDYLVYKPQGIIKRTDGLRWDIGLQRWQITYDYGYMVIPGAIQEAAIELSCYLFKNPDVSISQFRAGDITSAKETGIPKSVLQLIEPYTELHI